MLNICTSFIENILCIANKIIILAGGLSQGSLQPMDTSSETLGQKLARFAETKLRCDKPVCLTISNWDDDEVRFSVDITFSVTMSIVYCKIIRSPTLDGSISRR